MRRAALACTVVTALVAVRSAVAAPWADWVGDYKSSLIWRNCTAPGEKIATIAIDAVDGALHVDLAPAGAALRRYSLQQNAAGWTAQDGDVDIALSRTKPNELELAVEIGAGCTLRGKLVRSSTRITACDRLLGWARIASTCTKTSDRTEDFAALVKAKWKASDAKRCTARAGRLELAMIDAGCAPHPDPEIGTRATECRALADATAKLARCGRVPRDVMQRLAHVASALSAAARSAERATLPYVERQCKDARVDVSATAVQFQCR